MSAYLVLSVPSISGLRFCLKVDSWHCLPSNTGIYSNRAVHVWMIRLCFSHFPIAEPKNSSPSLELCHAESFLFVFFVPGVIKAAQAVQNKRKEALLLLNMMVKLWYDHPHISLTPLSKTAGSDEKAVCEIGTDTPTLINQCGSQHTLTQFSDMVSLTPCSTPKHPLIPFPISLSFSFPQRIREVCLFY